MEVVLFSCASNFDIQQQNLHLSSILNWTIHNGNKSVAEGFFNQSNDKHVIL